MNTYLCILTICVAFASRGHATPKIFLDSVVNGENPQKITVTEWYIEPTELDHLPAYDPAVDAPPVSVVDAIKIARAQVNKGLVPESDVWFQSIELHEINRGNSGEVVQETYVNKLTGKWYYKVNYSIMRPDPKLSVYTYPMHVYVLMDGTISECRERPQTKQEREENDQFIDQIEKEATADAAARKRK